MPLSVTTLLERSSLFRGLPAATLKRIAALAKSKTYPPQSVVFFRGDAGNALFSVMRGRVRISSGTTEGKEVFLNIMEAGDSFGEIALLDGSPRTATATAMMRTELLIIEREHFLGLLRTEPQLAPHLIQLLCRRIRWTAEQLEDSALLTVPARLAKRLMSMARLHGHPTPDGIRLTISQQELARFLSLSRQIVNQHLQSWRDKGWIALGRSSVTIIAARALQSLDRSL